MHRHIHKLETELSTLRSQLGDSLEVREVDVSEFEAMHPRDSVTDSGRVLQQALEGRSICYMMFVSSIGEELNIPAISLWLDNGWEIMLFAVPDSFEPEHTDFFGALKTIKRGSPKLVWSVSLFENNDK